MIETFGIELSDGRPSDVRRTSVGRPLDVLRTSIGRPSDVRRAPSNDRLR